MIIIEQYKLNHEGATNKGSIIQQIEATKERYYRNFTYQKGSAVFGCIYPSRRFVLGSIFCLRSVSFWKNKALLKTLKIGIVDKEHFSILITAFTCILRLSSVGLGPWG